MWRKPHVRHHVLPRHKGYGGVTEGVAEGVANAGRGLGCDNVGRGELEGVAP